jgi:hypothetical protein
MASVHTDNYSGPERRRRRVYVTRNHEYHCLDGICIAVRDVKNGAFLRTHSAVGKTVSSGVRLGPHGIQSISRPEDACPGERIHFVEGGLEDPQGVLTSPLRAMERPDLSVVAQYATSHDRITPDVTGARARREDGM